MKNGFPFLSLRFMSGILLLATAGCGGGGQNLMPHTVSQVAQIKEVSTCEVVNPSSCPAQFGFAIDNMGNFTAGPSPTGKIVSGTITAAELSALQSALAPMVASSSMNCSSGTVVGGVSDQISASFTDGTQANLFTENPQTCFLGSSSDGQAFTNLFHQLMMKYYPIPFPA